MILGTGIDIIEIGRIKTAMDRNPRFIKRLYTEREIQYFKSRGNNPCHAAGIFAAKEAVLKAMGTGLRGFGWKDIEIIRDGFGKPVIALHGRAKTYADQSGIESIHISISHSKEYAVAEAVAEGNEKSVKDKNTEKDKNIFVKLNEGIKPIEVQYLKTLFPKRAEDSNKGTYGRAYIIAGSKGMMGAAAMCTLAALRCGAGIVELGVPSSLQPMVAPLVMEAIVNGLCEEDGKISYHSMDFLLDSIQKSSSFAIGPGLSKSERLFKILDGILKNADVPGVIDADGLNLLSQNTDILYDAKGSYILTPHPGEMARLIGRDVKYVQKNRVECARNFSLKYNVVTVLKGWRTIVSSPEGEVCVNTTGNPGMAKGGSGDVLTGMIVSYLAQGMKPFDAACAGVYIHGLAGDMAARDKGEYGMKAGDIIEYIPYAIKSLYFQGSP